MRVLILNWKDLAHQHAGGAEVYTEQVARRWVRWGHDVTLFCAAVPGAPAREDVDGVTVIRRGGRLGVYAAARRFVEREAPNHFDVIIDEVNTRPFLTPRYVRGVPVIAFIHQVAREIWFHETPWPVAVVGRYVLEPRWLREYRDVPTMTVSQSSADSLRAYGLRDIVVVPEGIDLDAPRTVCTKAPEPTVCFVGRLTSSKRPDHVLEAFALLRERVPNARLDMVGDGPLRRKLEARNVAGVTFHGRVDADTKFALMERAHALALTSVREGWGLVVDEAAAVGTRTIAYDRPGLRDSVPAAGGELVAPLPSAMADGLARVLPVWRHEARGGWKGGATDWDTVAKEVLRHVADIAEL